MSGLPQPKRSTAAQPLPSVTAPPTNITRPDLVGVERTYGLEKGLQDAINNILRTTLEVRHRTDPYVISFINQYVVCRHAGEAAKLSGMDAPSGRALLRRMDIMRAIEEITALEVTKFGYTADDVVERQKEIHDFDPVELMDDNGCWITDLRKLPGHVRRAIKEIDIKVDNEKDPNGLLTGRVIAKSVQYKFYDKQRSGELLSREKGVFKEKKVIERDLGENARSVLLGQASAAQARKLAVRDVGGSDGE